MAVTASDIVSDTDVRAIVDKIRNAQYQSRRAFRRFEGQDLNSNSFEFPIADNDLDGEVQEIQPGGDYPRGKVSRSGVTATASKYGVEIAIPDEAVDDSAIDVELEQQEDMIRAEERETDTQAFTALSGNTNTTTISNSSADDINYVDVVGGREQAFVDELNMGEIMLLAAGENMSDFVNMTEFTQASELGDMVIETGVLPGGNATLAEGFLGVVNDIPVFLENAGNFTEGQAFLVDTSSFGWEFVRWDQDVEQYREDSNDQDVWKINGRWDWVATNSTANIEIDNTS